MRLLVLMLSLFATASVAQDCHGLDECQLGDRGYHVLEPDGWDGTSPLPVLLHFHGWKRQGETIMTHARIAGATRKRGVLLVAPDGLNRSWDFWEPGSRDTDFAAAVMAEVAKRYPIDESRTYVSGYSWGSNMAWRYVCENGTGVTALLAISGTLDQNEQCETKPYEVRQVYGLEDNVLRYPYGPDGDETYPVALWRALNGCAEGEQTATWNITERDTFTRWEWHDCALGGPVTFDIHQGGHWIPRGWIARQLDELMGLQFSYP